MTMTSREQLLARTFVDLADTLVADFDVIDFLHTLASRSVQLLDVDAVGIMLADAHGDLHVMASSAEEARMVELYELQNNEGPCLDCFRSGRRWSRRTCPRCAAWPVFIKRLQQIGYQPAQVLPMRLRDETIGALNLFRIRPGRLSDVDLGIGQAMAHVATVGLIQERAIATRELLATQLQTALTSRVQLEQAKGMLAQRTGLQMDQAFHLMRAYARSRNHRLSDVAAQIINGSIGDDQLRDGPHTGPS
jgi:hypothetical protein